MMEQQPHLHAQALLINKRLYDLSPDSTTSNEEYNRLSGASAEDGKSCLICGHVSHGFHFGILACRTVAENKVYKCRQQCNCPIRKDMRNTCRHCRFNKCVALGMNKNDVQMNRDPIGRRRDLPAQIVECCTKPSACCDVNGQIRSLSDEAEMDTDSEFRHPQPVSSSASVSPLSNTAFNVGTTPPLPSLNPNSLATSSTSAAFALANILPHFTSSGMQPVLPSFLASQAPGISQPSGIHLPMHFTPVPGMTSFQPTATCFSALNQFPVTSMSTAPIVHQLQTMPLSSLAANLSHQQQQATMTLLQNATELATREERERIRQNELRLAQVQKAESPAVALLPYTPPTGPSVLQRLQEGYANYQSSQKSLYTVMYPDNIFAAETYRLVKHSEHVKMERGCLSLMFSMVNDWFQPFDTLDHTLKVLVLRAFSTSFSHLDQCFKTISAFTEADDTRFVLHYGQYIDSGKLEFFFQEHKDPTVPANTAKDTIFRCRTLSNKMRKLQVRDIEIAALAGLILWNEVALASAFNNTDKIRDRIYSELHNNIILNYGIMDTGARMGALLCLLHDLNVISKEITESVLIGKIFNPHALDLWEDGC